MYEAVLFYKYNFTVYTPGMDKHGKKRGQSD
jgi:hypothetical protein